MMKIRAWSISGSGMRNASYKDVIPFAMSLFVSISASADNEIYSMAKCDMTNRIAFEARSGNTSNVLFDAYLPLTEKSTKYIGQLLTDEDILPNTTIKFYLLRNIGARCNKEECADLIPFICTNLYSSNSCLQLVTLATIRKISASSLCTTNGVMHCLRSKSRIVRADAILTLTIYGEHVRLLLPRIVEVRKLETDKKIQELLDEFIKKNSFSLKE